MTVVPLNSRRISEYLERQVPDRLALRDAIREIRDQLPETVIFGGMIRDFALGSARGFASDIDLVSLASDAEIENVVRAFSPQRNKFGGFRFRAEKWRFDIWSLPKTWAFKEGLVPGESFDDLLATTFFNVDAAIFHLSSRTVRTSGTFSSGISCRILDVNLQQNPYPSGMARRALRMAMAHDFAMSARLVSYVVEQLVSRPPWVGEILWGRMLEHASKKESPFHIAAQREFPMYGEDDALPRQDDSA